MERAGDGEGGRPYAHTIILAGLAFAHVLAHHELDDKVNAALHSRLALEDDKEMVRLGEGKQLG